MSHRDLYGNGTPRSTVGTRFGRPWLAVHQSNPIQQASAVMEASNGRNLGGTFYERTMKCLNSSSPSKYTNHPVTFSQHHMQPSSNGLANGWVAPNLTPGAHASNGLFNQPWASQRSQIDNYSIFSNKALPSQASHRAVSAPSNTDISLQPGSGDIQISSLETNAVDNVAAGAARVLKEINYKNCEFDLGETESKGIKSHLESILSLNKQILDGLQSVPDEVHTKTIEENRNKVLDDKIEAVYDKLCAMESLLEGMASFAPQKIKTIDRAVQATVLRDSASGIHVSPVKTRDISYSPENNSNKHTQEYNRSQGLSSQSHPKVRFRKMRKASQYHTDAVHSRGKDPPKYKENNSEKLFKDMNKTDISRSSRKINCQMFDRPLNHLGGIFDNEALKCQSLHQQDKNIKSCSQVMDVDIKNFDAIDENIKTLTSFKKQQDKTAGHEQTTASPIAYSPDVQENKISGKRRCSTDFAKDDMISRRLARRIRRHQKHIQNFPQ